MSCTRKVGLLLATSFINMTASGLMDVLNTTMNVVYTMALCLLVIAAYDLNRRLSEALTMLHETMQGLGIAPGEQEQFEASEEEQHDNSNDNVLNHEEQKQIFQSVCGYGADNESTPFSFGNNTDIKSGIPMSRISQCDHFVFVKSHESKQPPPPISVSESSEMQAAEADAEADVKEAGDEPTNNDTLPEEEQADDDTAATPPKEDAKKRPKRKYKARKKQSTTRSTRSSSKRKAPDGRSVEEAVVAAEQKKQADVFEPTQALP